MPPSVEDAAATYGGAQLEAIVAAGRGELVTRAGRSGEVRVDADVVDPFPDGKIRDKGCGAKKADKTRGGDILIDVETR